MKLTLLDDSYQVIKLKPDDIAPAELNNQEFYSITKTKEEVSIVASCKLNIQCSSIEKPWKIIKIDGILNFNLIGILAKISNILADNQISIFVVSTFNTDYILVAEANIDKAVSILSGNGYQFQF